MPPVPDEQRPGHTTQADAQKPYLAASQPKAKKKPPPPSPLSLIHQRDGDRGSADDGAGDDGDDADADAVRLPVYCRYRDLVKAGITTNWPHLLRLIDHENFPPGIMPSRNIRAFPVDEVLHWLATRPTARKAVAPAKKPRRHGPVAKKPRRRPVEEQTVPSKHPRQRVPLRDTGRV